MIINPFEFEINCTGIAKDEVFNQLINCENAAKQFLSNRMNMDEYLDALEGAGLDMDEFLYPVIDAYYY
jgi:hypothetical protein